MPARLYAAGDRLKAHEMNYSTAADFALGPEQIVPSSIIFDEPGWSPYCLDHETGELILLWLPAATDLAKSPFYFVAQYRHAERVLKLPLAEIEALVSALPDPPVAIIYSMGRCGTTLASRALDESPHAWSLSEPEVFNHRSLILPPNSPISGGALVRAMIRLIFAQRAKREATTLALKLRSQSLFHMQHFIDGRPDARAIFMYRDAIGWAQLVFQFLGEFDWEFSVPAENRLRRWDFFSGGGPLTELARYTDLTTPETSLAAMIAAGWMHHLDTYLTRLHGGAQFLALRYNDLNANREAEIARMFRHAGVGNAGLESLSSILDEDSQRGTSIGRREGKRRLDEAQLAEIRAVLARQPSFADPNLILPDIYNR